MGKERRRTIPPYEEKGTNSERAERGIHDGLGQSSTLDGNLQIQQSARRVQFVRVAARQLQSGWSGGPGRRCVTAARPCWPTPAAPCRTPIGRSTGLTTAQPCSAWPLCRSSPPTDRHPLHAGIDFPTERHPIGGVGVRISGGRAATYRMLMISLNLSRVCSLRLGGMYL